MLLVFQNKDNIGIIGFWSMHFEFALDLSDIHLLNVDLLDQRYTHLDLFFSKTSWRRLQDLSSGCLQDMSSRRLQGMSPRRLRKTSSRRLGKMSSRRLGRRKIVTLKTCWRRLQDMSWRRPQDVLKTNECLLGIDILSYISNIRDFNKFFFVRLHIQNIIF